MHYITDKHTLMPENSAIFLLNKMKTDIRNELQISRPRPLWYTWHCTHTELRPSFKKWGKRKGERSSKNRDQKSYHSVPSQKNCIHFLKLKLFSYNFPFFIWFIPLVDIIGIKSKFKKVGAIPCGCNTKWTGPCMLKVHRACLTGLSHTLDVNIGIFSVRFFVLIKFIKQNENLNWIIIAKIA